MLLSGTYQATLSDMSAAQDPGEWLKEQLDRRQLTTRDVAQAVGLRDQAVYYWLTGKTSPKDEAAAKLAELLEVPEVEVRQRFGLWTPDATAKPASIDVAELVKLKQDLLSILERIDKLSG